MMDSCCKVVPQAEISTLKDTLCAQQKLLQQLYNELEAEREASATAASEALSVILRLQGEKAAVKMEAEQYKRLAEQRMGYAEESFAMIEDMITEKEMEVAELDYQVQTYRYQLMSMGIDVPPAADDANFPENIFQRNERDPFKGKKAVLESSTSTDLELISEEVDEFDSDSERKADEGISCYAGQIKELQQRVKDIAGANLLGFMSEAQSPSNTSRPSDANLSNIQPETRLPSQLSISSSTKLDLVNKLNEKSEAAHSLYPPKVHDVFEVPHVDEEYESPNKEATTDILESKDQSQLKAVKLIPKDETDSLKKLLQSTHHEKSLCKPSAVDHEIVLPTSTFPVSLEQPMSSVDVSQSNLNEEKWSPEICEVERPAESPYREEELKLLKEIKQKINELQVEVTLQKVEKSHVIDEPSLQPLAEVMISFWL